MKITDVKIIVNNHGVTKIKPAKNGNFLLKVSGVKDVSTIHQSASGDKETQDAVRKMIQDENPTLKDIKFTLTKVGQYDKGTEFAYDATFEVGREKAEEFIDYYIKTRNSKNKLEIELSLLGMKQKKLRQELEDIYVSENKSLSI